MAIANPTKLSDFSGFIPANIAAPIFDKAAERSAVMSLCPRVPLAGNGTSVPVTTGVPAVEWVAEGAQKPASSGSMALRAMAPKKLATIVVVSQEVVRANPGGYVTSLYSNIADAFAAAFDQAALHGINGAGTGAGPFDVDLADTTKSVTLGTGTTLYNDLASAGKLLAADGKELTGWTFDPVAEWAFIDEVDGSNRPLFVSAPLAEAGTLRGGSLIGRPCKISQHAGQGTTLGFAGDWSQAAWGAVGGINYAVSTETSVTIGGTLVSLFEYNLVAIRAEAEYGFITSDATASHFVKFLSSGVIGTAATPTSELPE